VAKKRHANHVAAGNLSPRLYDDPHTEESIGIFGELEFAKKYNLYPDLENRIWGDVTDFLIGKKPWKLDVKVARNPHKLLIKDWEVGKSDVYVLGHFIQQGDEHPSVKWLGFEFATVLKRLPKVKGKFGFNKMVLSKDLKPMSRLEGVL